MNTIKEWLAEHNYPEVLRKIEKVERGWARKGTKTRRDWADVLAGNLDGSPKTIEGVEFPVLCAARRRKGWQPTDGCISKAPNEVMPPITAQARWARQGDLPIP